MVNWLVNMAADSVNTKTRTVGNVQYVRLYSNFRIDRYNTWLLVNRLDQRWTGEEDQEYNFVYFVFFPSQLYNGTNEKEKRERDRTREFLIDGMGAFFNQSPTAVLLLLLLFLSFLLWRLDLATKKKTRFLSFFLSYLLCLPVEIVHVGRRRWWSPSRKHKRGPTNALPATFRTNCFESKMLASIYTSNDDYSANPDGCKCWKRRPYLSLSYLRLSSS